MGLETVELVMAWEEEFGVEIPDSVAASLKTPRQVTDWLAAQLPGYPRDEIAAGVRRRPLDQLGIRPTQYREDARFVEDFGAG